MKIIKIGAEATLYLSRWHNRKVIVKHRIQKSYRHPTLDSELRKERIKSEVRLMMEARKIGISVPIIYDVDIFENKIVMEYVNGLQLKDFLNSKARKKHKEDVCMKLGEYVGLLHKNDITHGDLTTSNILHKNSKMYFIDFSLGLKSKSIENKGVDLHLLKESIKSAHPNLTYLFEHILEGYKKKYSNWCDVVDKMLEIEKRGRYTHR